MEQKTLEELEILAREYARVAALLLALPDLKRLVLGVLPTGFDEKKVLQQACWNIYGKESVYMLEEESTYYDFAMHALELAKSRHYFVPVVNADPFIFCLSETLPNGVERERYYDKDACELRSSKSTRTTEKERAATDEELQHILKHHRLSERMKLCSR